MWVPFGWLELGLPALGAPLSSLLSPCMWLEEAGELAVCCSRGVATDGLQALSIGTDVLLCQSVCQFVQLKQTDLMPLASKQAAQSCVDDLSTLRETGLVAAYSDDALMR